MKKLISTSFFLGLLLLLSCQQQDIQIKKEKLAKVAYSSLDKEEKLANALKGISIPANKGGRIMNVLENINSDSILKVLQSDSTSYTFTMPMKNESTKSFKNLVFRRTLNGFVGFVLEYESPSIQLSLVAFTGTVRKYDLEGKLLHELHLKNGVVNSNKGGRTTSCTLAGFSKSCTEEILDGWDHTTGAPIYKCGHFTVFITFDCYDYTPPDPNGSYGTYIADYRPAGGGGGTAASGGGNYNVNTEYSTFDPGDPIGVMPEISRAMDLQGLLLQNPEFLLEIPCTQLPKWQTLTQHRPSQAVMDKLQAIKNNYSLGDVALQSIKNASGEIVNLDYFPVTITTLPNNPATGQRFTAPEFLNYIRTHMNDFVNTSITGFSPSTITGFDEAQVWNSSNPLGGVIHLNIGGGAGDGSVICSMNNPNNWIFSTIELPYNPFVQGYDGQHPVSGNREFGFSQKANGSYTFYTRGVDRITDALDALVANNILTDPFQNPDALWNSFKNGVYNFTQSHSGVAVTPTQSENQIYRPDWNKVKEVLLGLQPISNLGCR